MIANKMEHKKQHFLVVCHSGQGHINPCLHLAKRLACITASPVTFSTAASAQRKLFPGLPAPDQEVEDGGITYIPFSDDRTTDDNAIHFVSRLKKVSSESLSSIVRSLGARGRPVTCVIYGLILPWAADVAKEYGIPSVLYWIQSATVFSLYYHYFRDPTAPAVQLPGLTSLQARDLPSFLTTTYSSDDPHSKVLEFFKETFETLRGDEFSHKPKVLVNTFDELEAEVLSAVYDVELIATGPTFPLSSRDMFEEDGKGYMEWLDAKAEKSVVYVSFGSIAVVKQRQVEEILKGLKASGRPYLLVLRKDIRVEVEGIIGEEEEEGGMVVEWCSQARVLSHASVGCFVSHCGWNSTLESMVGGVPIVGVPLWSDQGTNAKLAEEVWGTGVRSEVDGEGVLEGDELKRCLDLVMGEGERGRRIRERARSWSENAREAIADGGSSDQNLRVFLRDMMDCL